jgi:glucose-fructose oxidoreductase
MPNSKRKRKIRYAVVGLGHIAQIAVLPAFQHTENAELAAVVSSNPDKLRAAQDMYGVKNIYTYEQYDRCLQSGEIDAAYIAVPNDQHKEYAVRAAHAGIHVLCEKPMAVTSDDCMEMISACEQNNVKLMIGYRLHFEAANLKAIEIAQSGRLGDLRTFHSFFGFQVRPGNIRIQAARGGGAVYDIGIYCINAARYIFQDEPVEVFACHGESGDERFKEVDETTSAVLKFPKGRVATFTCSFNIPDIQRYTVIGTKGILTVEPAYDYALDLKHRLSIDGKVKEQTFSARDQFGPELTYFARCILTDSEPEPDGWEGLADLQIIEAVYKSGQCGMPVRLVPFQRNKDRANPSQVINKPAVEEPQLVHVEAPTLGS